MEERLAALERRVMDLEKQISEAKPTRPKRAVAITEDWTPRQKDLDWAKEEHPNGDIQRETERFIDYWLSKGEPRRDWDASFRNWIRKAADIDSRHPARRIQDRPTRIDEGNRDRRARAIRQISQFK